MRLLVVVSSALAHNPAGRKAAPCVCLQEPHAHSVDWLSCLHLPLRPKPSACSKGSRELSASCISQLCALCLQRNFPFKPWAYLSTHPYQQRWFAILDQSPHWRGWRPQQDEVAESATKLVMHFLQLVADGDDQIGGTDHQWPGPFDLATALWDVSAKLQIAARSLD